MTLAHRSAALLVIATLGALPLRVAHAQEPAAPKIQPEIRGDVIFGPRSAIQAGGGLQLPLGPYVRLGADALAGVRTGDVTGSRADGRVDLLGRFLLDPYGQVAYGFSAGAGLTARFEPGERVTPLLLVALELEGRHQAKGWVPAVQLGLGGGTRLGIVLRRGEPDLR